MTAEGRRKAVRGIVGERFVEPHHFQVTDDALWIADWALPVVARVPLRVSGNPLAVSWPVDTHRRGLPAVQHMAASDDGVWIASPAAGMCVHVTTHPAGLTVRTTPFEGQVRGLAVVGSACWACQFARADGTEQRQLWRISAEQPQPELVALHGDPLSIASHEGGLYAVTGSIGEGEREADCTLVRVGSPIAVGPVIDLGRLVILPFPPELVSADGSLWLIVRPVYEPEVWRIDLGGRRIARRTTLPSSLGGMVAVGPRRIWLQSAVWGSSDRFALTGVPLPVSGGPGDDAVGEEAVRVEIEGVPGSHAAGIGDMWVLRAREAGLPTADVDAVAVSAQDPPLIRVVPLPRIDITAYDPMPNLRPLIDEVKADWLRAGVSTERSDRSATVRALADAYGAAGLDAPACVLWVDSPYAGAWLAAALSQLAAGGAASMSSSAVRDLLPPGVSVELPAVLPAPGPPVYAPVRGLVAQRIQAGAHSTLPDVWQEIAMRFGEAQRGPDPDVEPTELDRVDELDLRIRGAIWKVANQEAGLEPMWEQLWATEWQPVRDAVSDELRAELLEANPGAAGWGNLWWDVTLWPQREQSLLLNIRDWVEDAVLGWSIFGPRHPRWPTASAALPSKALEIMGARIGSDARLSTALRIKRTVHDCGSQHEMRELGWFDCLDQLGFGKAHSAVGIVTLSKACGWWWPFEHVVICSDRPTELHLSGSHGSSDDLYGVTYADGFCSDMHSA